MDDPRMAGRSYSYFQNEEELRCRALAVADMLRQMQDATRNPPRGFGHSRGRGSQNKDGTQSFRGRRGGYQPQPWYRSSPLYRPAPPQKIPPQHKPIPWQRSYDNEWDDYHTYRRDNYPTDRKHRRREVSPSESDYDHHHEENSHHQDESISPQHLVMSLVSFPDFSASLLQLMEKIHLHPSAVRHIVSAYNQERLEVANELREQLTYLELNTKQITYSMIAAQTTWGPLGSKSLLGGETAETDDLSSGRFLRSHSPTEAVRSRRSGDLSSLDMGDSNLPLSGDSRRRCTAEIKKRKMDDRYDSSNEEEDYEKARRRANLENHLFAMKDILRQLDQTQDLRDGHRGRPYFRGGRGGRGRRPRGGRGGGPRGGLGGPQERGRDWNENINQDQGWHHCRGRPPNREEHQGREQGEQGGSPKRGSPGFEMHHAYRGRGWRPGGFQGPHWGHEFLSNPHHFDSEYDYFDQLHNQRHPNQYHGIRPQFLAETLSFYPDLSCSLLRLLEEKNMQPSAIREATKCYRNVFNIKDEVIELRPQIRICPDHCGPEGCYDAAACQDLHICSRYVFDRCHERNCFYGHRWRTGHNDPILRSSLIEKIPFPSLRRLLQIVGNPAGSSSEPLDLCKEYNSDEGCSQKNCDSLHLCLNFVTGLTNCKVSDCQLNHDIYNPRCCQLLGKHGISTNEAPRDMLVALLSSNPSLKKLREDRSSPKKKKKESSKEKEEETPDSHKSKRTEAEGNKGCSKNSGNKKNRNSIKRVSKDRDSQSSSDSEIEESSSDSTDASKYQVVEKKTKESVTRVEKERSPNKLLESKVESRRTIWSHYLQGDVPILEICYYSVEGSCRNEGNACQRLHATKHFHWQVSEQGTKWLNLRPEQVKCLEYAYCDPAKTSVDLPRLDPATLDYSVSGLFILMGREVWQADFKAMVLSNISKSKTLKTRRLCTEVIDGQKVKPASYVWYFLDKNSSWVSYGNVDTAGASHLVSNVTSDDIEKQFLQDPTSVLPFKNSRYSYLLDFKSMTQMNLDSRMARPIMRRPVAHLQEKKEMEDKKKASIDLPEAWERMQPQERMRLVSLPPSSKEYKTAVDLLKRRLPNAQVMKVQRIQNPYLWRAFQNKVREMTTIYKDEAEVDIRQLFHGTTSNIISNICAENFDWRLHGMKSGQSFGRGSYFAVNSDYSYKYTGPDSDGLRSMFIARVAVGKRTRGNSQMVRPPVNPDTGILFDSTVDSQSNPSIIVKYDKQEYYPEYLLTLS